MRTKPLHLPLDLASRTPVSLQIVDGIRQAIREGRLRPGEALPSTRPFAERLGVNRKTVLEAYDELAAEGLLVGRWGSGSYVADPLPAGFQDPSLGPPRTAVAFPLASGPRRETLPASGFSCRTGRVDPRLLPALALARSYRKALESRATTMPRERDAIAEGRLKGYIAEMLEQTAGIAGAAGNLVLTDGFDAALRLVAATLLRSGDRVVVEALGARRHWDILRQAGARLDPMPVDGEGLCVEALLADPAPPPRAVLLTPRCQYPTTVALAPARRRALLAWAKARGVALLECDSESGVQFGSEAPLPLAAEDPEGSVVHLGAFAKAIWPGLSLGYIQGPAPLIEHLASHPDQRDQGADPVFESVLSDFFLEGEFNRHLARLRTILLQRRDALHAALARHLGTRVSTTLPGMGMALWIRVAPEVDVDGWSERALRQGVAFSVGRRYLFPEAEPLREQAIRLGFASHTEEELDEIVRRMAAAL